MAFNHAASSRWMTGALALCLSRAPSMSLAQAPQQPSKPPNSTALKAWFAQHGSPAFCLWNRDPWAPIVQQTGAPAGAPSVPAPGSAPIKLRTLGGETAFACVMVTSGSESPLDLQLPPSVVLKARGGGSVRADVLSVGTLKSRLFGEVAAAMFSAGELSAMRAEYARPKAEQKLSGVASVPQQVLNWAAIKDFPILHLQPSESVALWLRFSTKGAPAGRYRGAMEAVLAPQNQDRARRSPVQRLAFELTIEPVELPSWTAPDVLTWSSLPAGEDAAYEVYLRDLYSHGVRWLWGWHPRALPMGFRRIIVGSGDFWASGTGGRWVDPNSAEEGAKIEQGGYDEAIARSVSALTERARAAKVPPDRWALEIWDEPNDFIAPLYLSVAQKVRRLNPNIRFFANPGAFTGGWHPVTLKTFEALEPIVSDWWPFEHHLSVEGGSHLKFVLQSGKPAGFYSLLGLMPRRLRRCLRRCLLARATGVC
jgi:hypothetical protein